MLVRHGESEHLVRGIASAERGCLGLTPRGRRQAAALAGRLGGADVLLASPTERAVETAEILRPGLGADDVRREPDLCELRLGEGDGLPRAEFDRRYPAFDLVAEPDRPVCPGGESWHAFGSRVSAMLEVLAEEHAGQRVVTVTHAGFIVMAFIQLFGVPRPGTGTRLDPDLASVTEWAVEDRTWRLVRFATPFVR